MTHAVEAARTKNGGTLPTPPPRREARLCEGDGMRWFRSKRHASQGPAALEHANVPAAAGPAVEMTGTTTFGADHLTALFIAHSLTNGGLLELRAQLVAEPENPADSNAISVNVEGARIGYLPGHLAAQTSHHDGVIDAQVQLWGTSTPEDLRVRGWVAAGTGRVAWPYHSENPPAITTHERRTQRTTDIRRMIAEGLEGGGSRATSFKQGMVGPHHYLETAEPIKQLKREKRFDEALVLCYGAIAAAERARDGREPAPWYTEQAAIIHRKLGQRAEEEAVLRRWLTICPSDRRTGSRIQERLEKIIDNKRE